MKPLTIEELKALQDGDYIYILDEKGGLYCQLCDPNEEVNYWNRTDERLNVNFWYSDYGTKWLAFKNKEQAECKGEIVELPCILKSNSTYPKNQVVYINEFGSIIVERFSYEQDAERRLAELRGEV